MAEIKTNTQAPVKPTQEQQDLSQQATDTQKTQPVAARTNSGTSQLDLTREKVTLNAKQVIEQMSVFGDRPATYRDDSPIQGEYWRFKFGGAIVTASPEFKKAYDAGGIYSATLTPTTFLRNVPDPNNAGMTMQQEGKGWSLDAFSTIEQMTKAAETMNKAAIIDLKIALQEKKMQAAVASITPDNINSLIGEDEIKKLLAAI